MWTSGLTKFTQFSNLFQNYKQSQFDSSEFNEGLFIADTKEGVGRNSQLITIFYHNSSPENFKLHLCYSIYEQSKIKTIWNLYIFLSIKDCTTDIYLNIIS